MAKKKRLVLFVEGDADEKAVPVLVDRLLKERSSPPWEFLHLDRAPLRVGDVSKLLKNNQKDWLRYLGVARKRPNLGGVLLLLDGDAKWSSKRPFCPKTIALGLAENGKRVGASTLFSVAIVFARQEYESWLIAGHRSLPGAKPNVNLPPQIEEAPRNAKGWLNKNLQSGYKEMRHHEMLTRLVNLEEIRKQSLRSFTRLESALQQLVDALESGKHIASPA
jgi:hypothetical protein